MLLLSEEARREPARAADNSVGVDPEHPHLIYTQHVLYNASHQIFRAAHA